MPDVTVAILASGGVKLEPAVRGVVQTNHMGAPAPSLIYPLSLSIFSLPSSLSSFPLEVDPFVTAIGDVGERISFPSWSVQSPAAKRYSPNTVWPLPNGGEFQAKNLVYM